MFVEEGEAALDKGNIPADICTGISLSFEHHQAELEYGVPFVFQPGVVFDAFIMIGGHVPAVFGGIGQTEILELFGEAGAGVSPIDAAAQFGGG